ncbi:MAG: response regulator transcription factor [Candidatus Didemnitutus sp.]|nr:response regulator transcription factor [Candidatus Didemnitutus sp.]
MAETGAIFPKAPPRIRVGVVDDDPHFMLYLESLLGASGRHEVVATAATAEAALSWPTEAGIHVVLLDVGLPGRRGSAAVAELAARQPQALIVMLTATTDDEAVLESIRGGAVGYVLKGGGEEEIFAAIEDALAGGAPMSPAIARRVLGMMRQAVKGGATELAALSPREREVLELVAGGAVDKEVAARLGISRSTVKNNLTSIYAKWRVRTRTEAAVKFWRTQTG